MQDQQIQLSGKKILEKDFKTTMRGYNQEEVDAFLDIIIQDYNGYQRKIDDLQNEINQLKKESSTTRSQIQPQPPKSQANHQVNYDVIKRLSNLEKEVFGKKHLDE